MYSPSNNLIKAAQFSWLELTKLNTPPLLFIHVYYPPVIASLFVDFGARCYPSLG
jgi:hypothetical protein